MDFLRSCKTNTYLLEDLLSTRFYLYKWQKPTSDRTETWTGMQKALTHLRKNSVLCTTHASDLWVFVPLKDTKSQLSQTELDDFAANHQGTLEHDPNRKAADGKPVLDLLLEAVEKAMAFSLAKEPGIVRSGPWTWILTNSRAGGELCSPNTSFRVHATLSSAHALCLTPEISSTALRPIEELTCDPNCSIVLAPFGRSARLARIPTVSDADSVWKAYVAQILQSNGIEIGSEAKWVTIQFADSSDAVPLLWPSHLCLAHQVVPSFQQVLLHEYDRWDYWFADAGKGTGYRDHLKVARESMRAEVARERAALDADQNPPDHDLTSNAASAEADLSASADPSPPFIPQGGEQQGGIYPTPPEGLTQGHPGPQMSAETPLPQSDQADASNDLFSNHDDADPDGSILECSISRDGGHEDLFGDMGGMDYAENEIEDEDFDFFDEPDAGPSLAHADDAEMSEAPQMESEPSLASETPREPAKADPKPLEPSMSSLAAQKSSPVPNEHQLDSAASNDHAGPPMLESVKKSSPEKALSPFGIRERILPPPIPASIAQNDPKDPSGLRRPSNFSPIAFKEGFNLAAKYAGRGFTKPGSPSATSKATSSPNISLPPTRKKPRRLKPQDDVDRTLMSESEEDSYESTSSESDDDLPPKLPWDSRKRKRHSEQTGIHPLADTLERMWPDEGTHMDDSNALTQQEMIGILERTLCCDDEIDVLELAKVTAKAASTASDAFDLQAPIGTTLSKLDISCIAQVITEQSATSIGACGTEEGDVPDVASDITFSASRSAIQTLLGKHIQSMMTSSADLCDLNKLALTREPPSRTVSTAAKTPQPPTRPPPRSDSSIIQGPDYVAIAPPYIRIQRGGDNFEMLPTCLYFWEALGLGPRSGPKNVRAFCVFPSNDDLEVAVAEFLNDLGTAYEGCKLGSHEHLRAGEEQEDDFYEDGMVTVELVEPPTVDSVLKAYAVTCRDFGQALATICNTEDDGRTIVVYMVNPFAKGEAEQHLCACFWMLFKAYREHVAKALRNEARCDVVLQLVPMSMIASFDGLAIPDAKDMAALAREVYDRCPPSASCHTDSISALPILAAPAVELACPPPKKIAFQLTSDPPSDLLHEGSVLHLAYSRSPDGQWITVVWLDSTAQSQASNSFCLNGHSFAAVAAEIWDRTCDVLDARQVTWRVFIVTDTVCDESFLQCWRQLVAKPRGHPLCVTMLSVQTKPLLQLLPPPPPLDPVAAGTNASENPGAGFLTPVSTPQPSAAFTSSPDVAGFPSTAPPTPAPSDSAAASSSTSLATITDADGESHLIDLHDESWGVLFSSKYTPTGQQTTTPALAHGALYKRGRAAGTLSPSVGAAATSAALPSLGVSLHWTIQIKSGQSGGGVDEGSIRQAEMTLREVLRMFRHLGVLTHARGLGEGCVPLHVALAAKGAEGVSGIFPLHKVRDA